MWLYCSSPFSYGYFRPYHCHRNGVTHSLRVIYRACDETTEISVIKDEIKPCEETDLYMDSEETIAVPDGVEVYEINGPYFLVLPLSLKK